MEDPRPTLQQFFILMEGTEPWSGCDDKRRDPGNLFGVTFQVRFTFSLTVGRMSMKPYFDNYGNLTTMATMASLFNS